MGDESSSRPGGREGRLPRLKTALPDLPSLDGAVPLSAAPAARALAQIPLDETALSPDSRMAAFPQRDEVVVVDLTAATSRRWPVPGFNEIVSWHPDGVTLVVEQEDTAYLVDSRTGHAARQPYPGFGPSRAGDPARTCSACVRRSPASPN